MLSKIQSALSTVSTKQLIAITAASATLGGFGLGYVTGRFTGRNKAPVVAAEEEVVAEAETPDAETVKE